MKLLGPNDASWIFLESDDAPVHVACLAIFSPPEEADPGFLADLAADWRARRDFAPPFNYRLRWTPLPAWDEVPAEEVDLEYHVRHSALPVPGGERELGVLISRLHSHALERGRPLWECHLIEGLERGRFALYLKMHHSQVDGIGGMRMLERTFSTDPGARRLDPPWAIGLASRGTDNARSAERRPSPLAWAREQARAVPAIAGALGGVGLDAVGRRQPELGIPFEAPMTILNGRIRSPRRYATQHYELDRIKRIAGAASVKINDVFLALCAEALRRYLTELDALPKRTLTAGVPVAVRPAGAESVGNAISIIEAKLYTDLADPVERLRAIAASTGAAKRRLEPLPKTAIDNYTMLLMAPYLAQLVSGLSGRMRPMHNLVISNVPGPEQPLYLNGARLEEFYPVSLLWNGQALNISVVSYAGQFNLGYTGCRDSLPSMQRIAVYTGDALTELEDQVVRT